jgi:putative spermidine/putrescine transport system permease protein
MTTATLPAGMAPARRFALRGGPAWLLAPAVIFLGFIYVLPLLDLFRVSLTGATLFANFERVFSVPLYWDSLVRTLAIAGWVVVLCALFGYPTALLIHRSRGIAKALLTGAIILPYFVAILIRTYAWMVLLGRNGPINKALLALGVIDSPIDLLFNRGAVLLGMSAVLMPLMVLTIYSGLSRIDPAVLRAARSAGAGPMAVFWRIFFPLSLPSVGAGCLLVFVSALGFFITPTLLGGPGDHMFAMHITQQADFLGSEGFLQALAVVLLLITLLMVGIAMRFLGLDFIWGGQKLDDDAGRTKPAHEKRGGSGAKAALADAIGWPVLRALGALPERVGTWFVGLTGGFVVGALTLPIVVVAIISFSRSSFLTFPPPALSTRWYAQFVSDSNWMTAFGTSVGVAIVSALLAVLIGASAAMAIVRSKFRGKAVVMTLLISPIIVPPVVLGLSLYSFVLRLDLIGTVPGVAMAHAIGGIPLVVVIVAAALQAVDQKLELAAAVHGASPLRVFAHVTLPGIAPGLAAAGYFAFLHSFDELVLSMFLAGSRMTTLPLRLWADINYQLNPVLAVVSTLEVLLVIAGITFARKTLAGRTQP